MIRAIQIFTLFILSYNQSATAQYIIHIAGNDSAGCYGEGIPASEASLRGPRSICRDQGGNLYISDGAHLLVSHDDSRVRKISATTGLITTVTGLVDPPASISDTLNNIPATSAKLRGIGGICIDKQGNLIIADGNNRIRKVNFTTGIITTIAGTSFYGYSGDGGSATAAALKWPFDVAVDTANNIYIVENFNNVIRKINSVTGIISTVAGNGTSGFSGDGGPATAAQLKSPCSLCVNTAGDIYICDRLNQRIRMVNAATGIITTVAGSDSVASVAGDGGPATDARLSMPPKIALDKYGNLFIVDNGGGTVRKVTTSTGIITKYAGTVGPLAADGVDSTGDGGLAISAIISAWGLCFDTCGNLFIGSSRCRIRAIVPTLPVAGPTHVCGLKYNEVSTLSENDSEELQLFPNPNTGTYTIKVPTHSMQPVHVSVITMVGTVVNEYTVQAGKETTIAHSLPSGMYILVATTENGRLVEKMVVR